MPMDYEMDLQISDGRLIRYCGSDETVEVPEGVFELYDGAFRGAKTLVRVILPSTLRIIGEEAFRECTALREIDLPEQTDEIRDNAFRDCTALTRVTFPAGLRRIYDGAFRGCTSLSEVELPDSVRDFYDMTFYECTSLVRAVLPKKPTVIPNLFFYNCRSLREIRFPEEVYGIGEGAFMGCERLEEIVLPNGLKMIDSNAFYECHSLRYAEYGGARYLGNAETPYYATIGPAEDLGERLVLHEHCRVVMDEAFQKNETLKEVIFPEGLQMVGSGAFNECPNLTRAVLPSTVKLLYHSAFLNCRSLSELLFSEDLIDFEGSYFDGCDALPITKEDGITYLARGENPYFLAIKADKPLPEEFSLHEGCVYPSTALFSGQTGLRKVTLPNSMVSISTRLFFRCLNLTEVVFPERLQRVESGAFYGCTEIREIVFPKTVTSICPRAFRLCKQLVHVEAVSADLQDPDLFRGCYDLRRVVSLSGITQKALNGMEDEPLLYTFLAGYAYARVRGYEISEDVQKEYLATLASCIEGLSEQIAVERELCALVTEGDLLPVRMVEEILDLAKGVEIRAMLMAYRQRKGGAGNGHPDYL